MAISSDHVFLVLAASLLKRERRLFRRHAPPNLRLRDFDKALYNTNRPTIVLIVGLLATRSTCIRPETPKALAERATMKECNEQELRSRYFHQDTRSCTSPVMPALTSLAGPVCTSELRYAEQRTILAPAERGWKKEWSSTSSVLMCLHFT
jgi:hypothetical protein